MAWLTELSYRKATVDDLKTIVRFLLEDELGSKREKAEDELDLKYTDAFHKIDADPNHYLMVVEKDFEIVGTCHLTLLPSLSFIGSARLQIEEVRIDSKHRGQKIGEWMIKAAIEYGKTRGANIVQLTTNKERRRVKEFYERLGFRASHEGMKLYLVQKDPSGEEVVCGIEHRIRAIAAEDIPNLVDLSYEKRRAYEKAQPVFWKHATGAEETQAKWFMELLSREDYIMLAAEQNGVIAGFIIGKLENSPAVYSPGGLTICVDDFCVKSDSDWESAGGELIDAIKSLGKIRGASQIIVVCGAHDVSKRNFLRNQKLSVASEWFTSSIS